jgi:hypothetical protein
MKAKWDRRDQKQKNKKKFKDYTNNVKSVTLLADIIFGWKKMGRKNWNTCHDCGRKINVKRNAKSKHEHGCEYCWLKNRKKERKNVHI